MAEEKEQERGRYGREQRTKYGEMGGERKGKIVANMDGKRKIERKASSK